MNVRGSTCGSPQRTDDEKGQQYSGWFACSLRCTPTAQFPYLLKKVLVLSSSCSRCHLICPPRSAAFELLVVPGAAYHLWLLDFNSKNQTHFSDPYYLYSAFSFIQSLHPLTLFFIADDAQTLTIKHLSVIQSKWNKPLHIFHKWWCWWHESPYNLLTWPNTINTSSDNLNQPCTVYDHCASQPLVTVNHNILIFTLAYADLVLW